MTTSSVTSEGEDGLAPESELELGAAPMSRPVSGESEKAVGIAFVSEPAAGPGPEPVGHASPQTSPGSVTWQPSSRGCTGYSCCTAFAEPQWVVVDAAQRRPQVVE